MRLLTLNCQRGYNLQRLQAFFRRELHKYDFIFLQEVSAPVYRLLDAALKEKPYAVLTHFHDAKHMVSENCIIAKDEYRIIHSSFMSFQHMAGESGEVGAVMATYSTPNGVIALCSAHFHSHAHVLARKREVRMLKDEFLRLKADLHIIAGDFNTMFLGENAMTERIMRPEFRRCRYTQHSHDTIRLERTHPSARRIARMADFGLRFRTQLDHFYISPARDVAANVLDEAGSDHLPVEITV